MARIMAIDYGDVRIGIALTDPLKIISSGYKTLKNTKDILEEILNICKLKEVESIVLGIPFNKDYEIGPSAQKAIDFGKLLNQFLIDNNLILPFYGQDEGYTTREAISIMREFKVKRKKKRKIVDQIAASKILSDFLNSKNKNILTLST